MTLDKFVSLTNYSRLLFRSIEVNRGCPGTSLTYKIVLFSTHIGSRCRYQSSTSLLECPNQLAYFVNLTDVRDTQPHLQNIYIPLDILPWRLRLSTFGKLLLPVSSAKWSTRTSPHNFQLLNLHNNFSSLPPPPLPYRLAICINYCSLLFLSSTRYPDHRLRSKRHLARTCYSWLHFLVVVAARLRTQRCHWINLCTIQIIFASYFETRCILNLAHTHYVRHRRH
jgi:hypothetical protein